MRWFIFLTWALSVVRRRLPTRGGTFDSGERCRAAGSRVFGSARGDRDPGGARRGRRSASHPAEELARLVRKFSVVLEGLLSGNMLRAG